MKLTKITKVLLFSFIALLSSCENESTSTDAQDPKIVNAKKWFDDFKAAENFHPIFRDVDYLWESAITTNLVDGTTAIVVTIKDIDVNPEYKGEKKLYLYPAIKGYDAVVQELLPDPVQDKIIEGFKKLDSYTGYIITWDLIDGFVKGAKFENNKVVCDIVADLISDNEAIKAHNLTRRAPPVLPIPLDEVMIMGGGGSGGTPPYTVRIIPSLGNGGGAAGAGGYVNSPPGGGSGGGGSSATVPNSIEKNIDDTKLDACLKAIMEKLKNATNADIASILKKLGANSLYTVTMKMGSADTYAETQKISKNNYEIRIDPTRNTDGTTLYKANALVHEIIHAYFLTIVDDYNSIPTNAPMADYPTLFDAYVKIKNPSSADLKDAQHKEMADQYVDAIASTLQEFVGDYTISYQVYTDLAWGGLSASPIFAKTFKPDSAESERILNRYKAEGSGHAVGAGTITAQTPVGRPCN